MRLRIAVIIAALMGLMALALPAWTAPSAKLIHVHVFKSGGKPGPAAANCSNDGAATNGYELTGWEVAGARTAYLNTATVPAGLGSVTNTLQTAFDVWRQGNAAPRITVATGGTATRYTANRTYDLMFGRVGGSSIAVTYTWRWSDGFIESDVVFNNRMAWKQLGAEGDGCYESEPVFDLGNIATHEFGHVYGLDHPAGARFETMYAYGFTGETLKRSPTTGDLAGMNDLY